METAACGCLVFFFLLAHSPALAQPRLDPSTDPSSSNQRSEPVVWSTHESEAPPHSPSTLGNAYGDPANYRRSPALKDGVGLLHVLSADFGPRGVLRFSAFGEYFKLNDFPVVGAIDTHFAGTFAFSWVALDFLELALSYSGSANTSSQTSPSRLLRPGDISLGANLASRWARGFTAGVGLALKALSNSGDQGGRRYRLGLAPVALATYDFGVWAKLPLVAHGNVGAAFDGDIQGSGVFSSAEEFALQANRFNRLTLGIGLELPLPWLTPFVEYDMSYPLRVPSPGLVGPDGQLVPTVRAMAHSIGLGAKVTAAQNLTFTGAVDLGLSRAVGLGIPATPAFNVFLGAAFNVDLLGRSGTKVVETVIEPRPPIAKRPPTARLRGVVLDAQTHRPVPGAIVTAMGSGVPPVASDLESGTFLTHELSSGALTISIQKDGYRPLRREVVLAAGNIEDLQVELEALPAKSLVLVSVTASRKPIAAAVSLRGPQLQKVSTEAGIRDPVRVEVPVGKYVAEVFAQGYLAQTRELEVREGEETQLRLDLLPEPRKRLVVVRENKIEILQQVHFANGRATILPSSFKVLNQVVEAIIQNNIKRIRVEGHADNRGGKSLNQNLSEKRARAVAKYLQRAGISASRIDTAGFGNSRPVAPNITAHGREFNRRVEFAILDR